MGVVLVDRLALGEPLVVVVGGLDGADLGALAAARAFGEVHVTGVFADDRGEVPGLALQFNEFRIGEQIDVDVPADLDQFG
jgi:hypothetical protein